jgi:hypothetical protein
VKVVKHSDDCEFECNTHDVTSSTIIIRLLHSKLLKDSNRLVYANNRFEVGLEFRSVGDWARA